VGGEKIGQKGDVSLYSMWDGACQMSGSWANDAQYVIANKYIHPKVQNSKTVVTGATDDREPRRCLHGEIRSDKAAIDGKAPDVVAALEGGHGVPSWVRMSSANSFMHMEAIASEHVREGARRHILICIQKDNKAITILPQKNKLPLEVPQEHDAGAVHDPRLTEMAALLFIYHFLSSAVAGDVNRNNSGRVTIPALEVSPRPSSQIAVIHARIRHTSRQLSHS
jgi:hypothetical protein